MARQRINDAAAFLLHAHPYSETSLILEIFAREHGRLAVMARGARRPRSAMRGLLQAFQPLELSWFGGGEVKTLARAEWLGGLAILQGEGLMLGYYLNELLLKLLPREDAHAGLYDAYAAVLAQLAAGRSEAAAAAELRRFEKILLRELGYGLLLERDTEGRPIQQNAAYRYLHERGALGSGVVPADAEQGSAGVAVTGKTLLDMAADDYADPRSLAESKQLMRYLLSHYLGGLTLQTRRVFIDLQDI